MSSLIDKINSPADLKELSEKELETLAGEMREFIIESVSKTGGHLAPNLGVIELTIAMHYVFNSPYDRIVWDVGHQSYPHKIITGRKRQFDTLRQFGGISGFPRREESPHDAFNTGHASTSVSSGLGISEAIARLKTNGKSHAQKVIAVIGDGALTGGLALEGLNQAGHMKNNLLVVFNDNKMSISSNVGALQAFVSRKVTGEFSLRVRKEIKNFMKIIPSVGDDIYKVLRQADSMVKRFLSPGLLFEAFGFKYVGPIPGHNIPKLIQSFDDLKDIEEGPILLHVVTHKGKGYSYSEDNPEHFHGVGPFNILNPNGAKSKGVPTYTEVFGNAIAELAKKDDKIVAISAAMKKGTGLDKFSQEFPERFYDVGIAEQHATTFAAGLASQGLKPVFAVYSTFLQRAYDQIIHDVCLQKLPVVFAIDRAGIVGDDGSTHQGLFDYSFLKTVPGITVMAPKDESELRDMLYSAFKMNSPVSIRYPRGKGLGVALSDTFNEIPIGKGETVFKEHSKPVLMIAAIGNMVYPSIKAAKALSKEGLHTTVINARFVKPLDSELICTEAKSAKAVITVEENVITGGFGSCVLECLNDAGISKPVLRLGIPDEFVEHGSQNILRNKYKLNFEGILESAVEFLTKLKSQKSKRKASKTDVKQP